MGFQLTHSQYQYLPMLCMYLRDSSNYFNVDGAIHLIIDHSGEHVQLNSTNKVHFFSWLQEES